MAGSNAEALSTIDPGFEALMKQFPAANFDLSKAEFSTIRANLAERKRNLTAAQAPPIEGITITNRTIPARDGWPIPIRTYVPATKPPGGSPLILFFHGGGFCIGDIDGEELNCRLFAQKLGATVVNADYRLAPEHPFPAAVLDAWDALKWTAEHGPAELGADAAAGFIVGGVSAGGNISAVLEIKARDEGLSPPLTGTALLIPAVSDYRHIPDKYKDEIISYQTNAEAPILPLRLIEKFMDAYKPDSDSPLYHVLKIDNYKDLPPTFFQVCGLDPLRDEALVYERVLREEYNVKTKLEVYSGVPHGFWGVLPQWETSKKFVEDTVKGIQWLLDEGKK